MRLQYMIDDLQRTLQLNVEGFARNGLRIDLERMYTAGLSIGCLCAFSRAGRDVQLLCAAGSCVDACEAEEFLADAHSAVGRGDMKQREFNVLILAAKSLLDTKK